MSKSKLLYSTNSLIAYQISNDFYGDKHYVYCSDHFGPGPMAQSQLLGSPPSSTPRYRYKALHEEFKGQDLHGPYINMNKAGLRSGALEKYNKGVIDLKQRDDILKIIENATFQSFKPLLYVINYDNVIGIIKEVPLDKRANPLYTEYIIEELPGELFDKLDLDDL